MTRRAEGGPAGARWPRTARLLGAPVLAALCALGSGTVLLPRAALAAGAADAGTSLRVDSVTVRVEGAAAGTQEGRQLEANARRALGVFPGHSYHAAEIDVSLARLVSSGVVGAARAEIAYEAGGEVALRVTVSPKGAAAPAPAGWSDRLKLVDDGSKLVKVRLGLKGALAISGNQWFDNGATLTEFNPRGKFGGGRGPNGILDLAPSVGLTAAVPLSSAVDAPYVYGTALYLGTASLGQDNNRSDFRTTGQFEEGYVGIVSGGATDAGLVWRANLSYGMQPYCIGEGMLLCQISSSGGDRGADFAWPRWSGKDFLKAQLRLNQTLLEVFRFQPNDFPSTKTRLLGFNADHDNGRGTSLGFTWLTAEKGQLGYFLPDGSSQVREGLRVWHLRGKMKPAANEEGLIAKLEFAQQTHSDFDMRAKAYSAEAGWKFDVKGWQPSISYRYSSASGDDPATSRYERWDLLYSGGDIDSWVQGQLMKNIQYNSNVKVHRVLARATPDPRWRLTGAVSSYRADTLNNIGGVISSLAGHDLGREVLLVAEHYASRQVYWRFTFASLWPGRGVSQSLPQPVEKPWLVGIVQFNINY